MGVGIEETNAGIGILASIISVQYRTKKMLDCIGLVWYWLGPAILTVLSLLSFLHSGVELVEQGMDLSTSIFGIWLCPCNGQGIGNDIAEGDLRHGLLHYDVMASSLHSQYMLLLLAIE